MTIRIGANPIGWTNDDLQEVGGDTPLETCLAEAREAGVVGMEKGHKMPSDGAALKGKLAEFGLSFVGGWYSTELLRRSAKDEFEAAREHIAVTKGAGADIVIAAETSNCIHGDRSKPLSERPHLRRDDWVAYGAKMTEFAQRIADEGLKLCYHHHMGTIVQSERDIDAFMTHTKPTSYNEPRLSEREEEAAHFLISEALLLAQELDAPRRVGALEPAVDRAHRSQIPFVPFGFGSVQKPLVEHSDRNDGRGERTGEPEKQQEPELWLFRRRTLHIAEVERVGGANRDRQQNDRRGERVRKAEQPACPGSGRENAAVKLLVCVALLYADAKRVKAREELRELKAREELRELRRLGRGCKSLRPRAVDPDGLLGAIVAEAVERCQEILRRVVQEVHQLGLPKLPPVVERFAAAHRRRGLLEVVEDKLKMELANAFSPVTVDEPAPLFLSNHDLLKSDEAAQHNESGRSASDPSLGEGGVGEQPSEKGRPRGQSEAGEAEGDCRDAVTAALYPRVVGRPLVRLECGA